MSVQFNPINPANSIPRGKNIAFGNGKIRTAQKVTRTFFREGLTALPGFGAWYLTGEPNHGLAFGAAVKFVVDAIGKGLHEGEIIEHLSELNFLNSNGMLLKTTNAAGKAAGKLAKGISKWI